MRSILSVLVLAICLVVSSCNKEKCVQCELKEYCVTCTFGNGTTQDYCGNTADEAQSFTSACTISGGVANQPNSNGVADTKQFCSTDESLRDEFELTYVDLDYECTEK